MSETLLGKSEPVLEMKTLIIAEAGVNHNGSLDTALRMVREAARAGADFVKFQTFNAADLVTASAPTAQYQNEATGESSQLDMLERLELTPADFAAIKRECDNAGIGFMSTPFSVSSADILAEIGQKFWKIPSGELTNLPLLRHIASLADNVIMSTGMATLDEVKEALSVLNDAGLPNSRIYLLHCTTAYPTPPAEVNLRAMDALRLPGIAGMGYSDHTQGISVPLAAVARGAVIIEKHFTLDRNLPGPDHKASLEPEEFALMVKQIRIVEESLGSADKTPSESETMNMKVARKSIVAARPIEKGEIFTEMNLTTKRPGTGVSPMQWDHLTGRRAKHSYQADQLINNDELQ